MNNILKVVKDIHIFGSHEVWSCHDVSWCFFVVFFLLLESTRFKRGMTVRILERWKRVHNALPKTIIYYRFLAWKRTQFLVSSLFDFWISPLIGHFFLTNFLHHGHGCLIAFRCIYFSHQHTNIALRTILSMFCSSFFEPQMYHYDKSCRAFCYVSKKPWYLSVCSLSNTLGHGFLDDRCYQHFLKLEDIRGSLNITRNIRNHPRRDDILYRLIISAEVAKVMVFQMDNLWMSWRVSWICWSMASNKWVPPTIRNWWSLWDSTLAVFGQFCFYSPESSVFLSDLHLQVKEVTAFDAIFLPKEEASDSSLDGARCWKRWWQSRFLRFFVTKTVTSSNFGCFCLQGKRRQRQGKRWQRQGQRKRKRSGTGTLHIAHCIKIESKT